MANMKEIQERMKSIRDTMKITNAMYMISSSKLKKAKKNLEDTEPYFYTLQSTMARILRHIPEMEDIYFENPAKVKPIEETRAGFVVVTADKGMAGAYNHNVIRLAEEEMAKYNDPVFWSWASRAAITLSRKDGYLQRIPLYRAEPYAAPGQIHSE